MKRTPLSLALAYFFGAVAALMVLVMLVETAGNSEAIREAQRTNTETLDLIKSCTTPGRKCYDAGQDTGKAVASINKVAVFAAACADKPGQQSTDEIEACVRRRLAPSLPAPR